MKRLENNRKCSINETNEQRMRRLTSDRNQHMLMCSIESDEYRVKQLAHDCEDHSITREFKSEVAYENRNKIAQENYYTLHNKNDINLGQNKIELKKFVEMKMICNIKKVYLLMHNLSRQLGTEQEHEQRLALV